MEGTRDIRIENCVEVLEKISYLPMDGKEWLRNVNKWHGIPQHHYSIEIKNVWQRRTNDKNYVAASWK